MLIDALLRPYWRGHTSVSWVCAASCASKKKKSSLNLHATQTQKQRLPHCESGNSIRAQCSPVDVGRLRASPQFLYELPSRGVEDSDEGPLWRHGAHKHQPLGQNTERDRTDGFKRGPVGLVQSPDPLGPAYFLRRGGYPRPLEI